MEKIVRGILQLQLKYRLGLSKPPQKYYSIYSREFMTSSKVEYGCAPTSLCESPAVLTIMKVGVLFAPKSVTAFCLLKLTLE